MAGNLIKKSITGLVLAVVITLAAYRTLPPPALPADAPAQLFSAGRAFATVKAITSSPRLVGSPAFESAKATLLAQMTDLGLLTDVQDTSLDGVKVENVLGRLPGSYDQDAILLTAHLDSVANSPGATDDGSGVAEVLETMRALQAAGPLNDTVIALITAPEENCCYGARAFVSQHPWAKYVRLVINVDAGGLSGPSILAATGPQEGWLIERMAGTLPDPVGSSAIEALGSPATDYTLLFRPAGWIGFDFNLSWSKRIHSPLDNVANVDLASLQHQGEHMLALVRQFAGRSLLFPQVPRPVYFDLLGLTILYYPTAWVIPILLVLTLLFAAVLFLGFQRKRLSVPGLASSTAALLLSLLSVPLLLGLAQLLFFSNPSTQLAAELTGDSLLSNSLRWGAAFLAVAATWLWVARFRKTQKCKPADLVTGLYLLLYLGACGTSLAFPGLSYIFVWPLLASLIALFIRLLFDRNPPQAPGWPVFLAALAAGVVAVLLCVPGIIIAVMSIDIRSIYFVPVFVTAWLGFLVAPLEIFFSRIEPSAKKAN
jgi:hypothetical protein